MTRGSWGCRCGYSNLGDDRCAACCRPSASYRRQLRRRRLVSAAFIALSCMAANALWSPAHSVAKAALTAAAPSAPSAVPAPSPPPPSRVSVKHASRPAAPAHVSTRNRPPAPTTDRCSAARQAVESAGDHLAPGFAFNCPSSDFPRWGATSLLPCGRCFVDINTALIGPNDRVLRYAVAHEFCHSQGIRDEQAADDCAAQYGFPNVYFSR